MILYFVSIVEAGCRARLRRIIFKNINSRSTCINKILIISIVTNHVFLVRLVKFFLIFFSLPMLKIVLILENQILKHLEQVGLACREQSVPHKKIHQQLESLLLLVRKLEILELLGLMFVHLGVLFLTLGPLELTLRPLDLTFGPLEQT